MFKVAKMVLIVVLMLALSWVPLHVVYMLAFFDVTMTEEQQYTYAYLNRKYGAAAAVDTRL